MIGALFSKVLEMTIWGSYSILVVLIVRLFLRRCDRKYAYLLWFAAFLNLMIPFHVEGAFSLFPRQMAQTADSVRATGMSENMPAETDESVAYVPEENPAGAENMTQASHETVSSAQGTKGKLSVMDIAGIVWCVGASCLLLYHIAAALKMQRKLHHAKAGRGGIRETDGIGTPFLWGVLRPTIYLPKGMGEAERTYIIAHELCHKKRKDYLIKPLLHLITILHWFNPLVLLAYRLCVRDMEISCDERVLSDAAARGEDIKKQYAESLFQYALKQNGYVMTPLTFGEPSVKERIQNVLHYHKKGAVVTLLALVCVVFITVGLFIKPKAQEQNETVEEEIQTETAEQETAPEMSGYEFYGQSPNSGRPSAQETQQGDTQREETPKENIQQKETPQEKELTISVDMEGAVEEIPAQAYQKDGFTILIPTEGWRLTGPELWTSTENDSVRLWVADMKLQTLEKAREALMVEGYQKTPEVLFFYKTQDGEKECVQLVTGDDIVWSVRYRYPDTAEYEEGFGSRLRAIAATGTFGEQPDRDAVKALTDSFSEAYFAGDVQAARSCLTEDYAQDIELYGGTPETVDIIQIKGLDRVESGAAIGSAYEIWVEFWSGTEDDSLTYLTLGFLKTENGWKIEWYGLEK